MPSSVSKIAAGLTKNERKGGPPPLANLIGAPPDAAALNALADSLFSKSERLQKIYAGITTHMEKFEATRRAELHETGRTTDERGLRGWPKKKVSDLSGL
jgi:hypothetical protein